MILFDLAFNFSIKRVFFETGGHPESRFVVTRATYDTKLALDLRCKNSQVLPSKRFLQGGENR